MAFDFKRYRKAVVRAIHARKPILIRGGHGKGKSEGCVYALADELGPLLGMEAPYVIERRASQMTEGDLCGMPFTDGRATKFNPMDWFLEACERPVFLFFDEVDRSEPQIAQALFELTDSRKLNGNYLHPDTVIISAVNGGACGDHYQVREMDPAELSRWTVFDVEPSVEDWLSWGKNNVAPIICDFISNNHNHLEHKEDFEPHKVYPSRRSWHRLSDAVTAENATLGLQSLVSDMSTIKNNLVDLYEQTTAFCGFEAAVAFRDYCEQYQTIVTPVELLNGQGFDMLKDYSINEHTAMVDRMVSQEVFKNELPEDQITNLGRYFMSLPSEVAMKLWSVLGDGELKNVENLHGASYNDKSVSSYLVEILTGEDGVVKQ